MRKKLAQRKRLAQRKPKALRIEVMSRGVRAPRTFVEQVVPLLVKELFLSKLHQQAIRRLRAAEALLVVFVSDQEIRRLNGEFRGKPKPTDVLSFEPVEPDSLGELVIGWDVIKRQAREHRHSQQAELCYMLLHGLLHLLRYDHGPRMFAIQDRIFDRLRTRF